MGKSDKYRVNGSEHFNLTIMYDNLLSMYDHLLAQRDEAAERNDWEKAEESEPRIQEIERLPDKAYCVGARVSWDTLKRIREIRDERIEICCQNALKNGADGMAAMDAIMETQITREGRPHQQGRKRMRCHHVNTKGF